MTTTDSESPVAAEPAVTTMRKPRPNHQQTLQILRSMTPSQKLAEVFKLTSPTKVAGTLRVPSAHP